MPNRLLIQSDPYQVRVAVFEDDRLTEINLERSRKRGVVGNVYKGRVSRILPGMQAAFVDIGLDRDAFLHAGDVRDTLIDIDGLAEADPQTSEFPPPEMRPIEELLETGQEIVVQVVKEPLPNKGARITSEVTLPGRYLVLVPTVRSLGVSRRIREPEERERLRGMLQELLGNGHGMIVRTAGEGRQREEFAADLAFLSRLWDEISVQAAAETAPALLHQDQDLAVRTIRDRLDDSFEQVLVDGRETFERVERFARETAPALAERIELYVPAGALFDDFGVEREVDCALRTRVWLPSGGYIVINPTEALVAIDVNTGRFVGRTNLEDTVVRTNLEAAREIVRQIRLRDLSGIIVVDFIDMNEAEHREQVFAALLEELERDRAKSQVLALSDFGLVEITRKRSRANLQRLLTRPCPQCTGAGRILSVTTVCLRLRRAALRDQERFRAAGGLVIRVHDEVAEALAGEMSDIVDELSASLEVPVTIARAADLHPDRYELAEPGA